MKRRIASYISLLICIILMFSGCETSKYETEINWAELSNYMCAVEIDDFNGDILKSGKYRFYPKGVDYLEKGVMSKETPIVWDIYVSDNEYKNMSELKKSEYVGTVGGISKDEFTKYLSAGKYVYVNYNAVYGEPAGYLMIEKCD